MSKIRIGKADRSVIVGGDVHGDVNNQPGSMDHVIDDPAKLAEELAQLRAAMKQQGQTVEHDEAIVAVGKAEQAARENDKAGVLQYLRSAGKWAFDVATKIGVNVAAEVIKKAAGIS
ncbi:MAG: hypothetical protein KC547_12155 [Anaerolineae bacterium]|nr:hypothetical protein [Anaerolineae bacterium]